MIILCWTKKCINLASTLWNFITDDWMNKAKTYAALRSVYTERDRERGLAAFAKEWSK